MNSENTADQCKIRRKNKNDLSARFGRNLHKMNVKYCQESRSRCIGSKA